MIQRIRDNGDAAPRYDYDAFGNQQTVDTDPNPFRYCGEYWDDETNLIYLRARYYDSKTGRFISQDSVHSTTTELPNETSAIDPLSLNLYLYCGNNPMMRVDPSGDAWEWASFWNGLGDGFVGFFTDTWDTVTNLPNIIQGAFEYALEDPLGAALTYGKMAIEGVLDPTGGRRKIRAFLGSIFEGDSYGAGKILGGHVGESVTAAASYAVGKVAEKVVNKIVSAVRSSKPASMSAYLTGDDIQARTYASNMKPDSGFTDVVVHGNPDSAMVLQNGQKNYLSHRELSNFLNSSPDYQGGPIRLVSCSTGAKPNGFAQNLANKMGVAVKAPTDTLWVWPSGRPAIGPTPFHFDGPWKTFYPSIMR